MNSKLPDEPKLTPFVRKVLAAVCEVRAGEVVTYGELGRRIGCRSAQAVGQALRRNPWAPKVPCHRVVAADGSLTGYAGDKSSKGLARKRELLAAEGVKFDEKSKVILTKGKMK